MKTNQYKNKIKSIRAMLGLTQAEFAKKLGVSLPTMSNWERGIGVPSIIKWDIMISMLSNEDKKIICGFQFPNF